MRYSQENCNSCLARCPCAAGHWNVAGLARLCLRCSTGCSHNLACSSPSMKITRVTETGASPVGLQVPGNPLPSTGKLRKHSGLQLANYMDGVSHKSACSLFSNSNFRWNLKRGLRPRLQAQTNLHAVSEGVKNLEQEASRVGWSAFAQHAKPWP